MGHSNILPPVSWNITPFCYHVYSMWLLQTTFSYNLVGRALVANGWDATTFPWIPYHRLTNRKTTAILCTVTVYRKSYSFWLIYANVFTSQLERKMISVIFFVKCFFGSTACCACSSQGSVWIISSNLRISKKWQRKSYKTVMPRAHFPNFVRHFAVFFTKLFCKESTRE